MKESGGLRKSTVSRQTYTSNNPTNRYTSQCTSLRATLDMHRWILAMVSRHLSVRCIRYTSTILTSNNWTTSAHVMCRRAQTRIGTTYIVLTLLRYTDYILWMNAFVHLDYGFDKNDRNCVVRRSTTLFPFTQTLPNVLGSTGDVWTPIYFSHTSMIHYAEQSNLSSSNTVHHSTNAKFFLFCGSFPSRALITFFSQYCSIPCSAKQRLLENCLRQYSKMFPFYSQALRLFSKSSAFTTRHLIAGTFISKIEARTAQAAVINFSFCSFTTTTIRPQ